MYHLILISPKIYYRKSGILFNTEESILFLSHKTIWLISKLNTENHSNYEAGTPLRMSTDQIRLLILKPTSNNA